MPIVATVAFDLLDMAMLRLTIAPSKHHSPVGQEHGRTIPLAEFGSHSGLAPENLTALDHFSVSAAISLPKSVGEPLSAIPPKSTNL